MGAAGRTDVTGITGTTTTSARSITRTAVNRQPRSAEGRARFPLVGAHSDRAHRARRGAPSPSAPCAARSRRCSRDCSRGRGARALPAASGRDARARPDARAHGAASASAASWWSSPIGCAARFSHALARVIASDPLGMLERGAEGIRAGGSRGRDRATGSGARLPVDDDGRRPLRPGGEGFRYDGEEGSRAPRPSSRPRSRRSRSAGRRARSCVRSCRISCCRRRRPSAARASSRHHAELGVLRAALGLPRKSVRDAHLVHAGRSGSARRALAEGRPSSCATSSSDAASSASRRKTSPFPRRSRACARAREPQSSSCSATSTSSPHFDPSFGPNLRRAASQVKSLIEKLCEKADACTPTASARARHLRRAHQYALSARATAGTRPRPVPAFTSRFGRAWIDALYAEMPAIASEHVIVHLASDAPSDPESR